MLPSTPRFRLSRAFIVASLMLSCGSALAEEPFIGSANYVMPGCRAVIDEKNVSDGELLNHGLCIGMVFALFDWGTISELICPPPQVTIEQTMRVVVRHIDDRPAKMHMRFSLLALEAMQAAWPCKR
jgi:hypothetical protein